MLEKWLRVLLPDPYGEREREALSLVWAFETSQLTLPPHFLQQGHTP